VATQNPINVTVTSVLLPHVLMQGKRRRLNAFLFYTGLFIIGECTMVRNMDWMEQEQERVLRNFSKQQLASEWDE